MIDVFSQLRIIFYKIWQKAIQTDRTQSVMAETDMTYIWCGIDGWYYCFNAIDTFTCKWLSFIFDVRATADATIKSMVHAVTQEKPVESRLILISDNGTQYTSKEFR